MKEVLLSIKRTPYQSLASFLVLFFTVFLSMVLFISLTFLYGLLNYLETKPQVTVYFKSNTPENNIFKIRDELSQSGKILSIKYISQKEAFKIYQEANKDNPLLLEMVSADIFPPSLEIYAKKPIFLPEIAEYLKKQGDVDEVQYQKDLVDQLLSLTNFIRKGSLIFFIYLLTMSILVLTTTTLFKIALKKDEIELLKLLGASKSFIRRPYVKEGLFMGFITSLFSFLIIVGLFFYFLPFLKEYFIDVPNLHLNLGMINFNIWPLNIYFFAFVYLLSLIFSCAITTISSYLATDKYLK